jgi:hypothetical protein
MATLAVQQLTLVVQSSCQSCLDLHEKITTLLTHFLSAPTTPPATLAFEKDLRKLLDECGRQVLEATFNHIEPEDTAAAPKHAERDRQDYTRKNQKSRNRGGIATLFGTIELQRCLYEPLQEARDDGQRCFSPLELALGIVGHNATPALAERVSWLASKHTQQEVLDIVLRDHHVHWSVTVLRQVTAEVSAGIAPFLRQAQRRAVLHWLVKAKQSRGRLRVVLAVGRDGIMLPIRHEKHYKEGGVATIAVYDRRGKRLGTVYLGEMPEANQVTLTAELKAFVQEVLADCEGPLPRLVYLTDAGHHQSTFYEEVLSTMDNPRQPGKRLEWLWIIDYYHAASYVTKLADVLFDEEKTRQAWSRRMRRILRDQDRGVIRVLHSAAQYWGRKHWGKKQAKAYDEAYNYLLRHSQRMQYSVYRRQGLPIGSGVTEAGCKVVFTQRFKQSGMTWNLDGGEVILRLRLAELSGVWDEVYQDYLRNQPVVLVATPAAFSGQPSDSDA